MHAVTLISSIISTKKSQYVLVIALGVLAVLGFAPFYLFPLPVLSLFGLFVLWHKTNSPRTAFKLGFAFGLGLYVAGIYWIYISLHDYGGMPWWFAGFCTFCLCAFMALFPALVGYLSKRAGTLWLTAPVLWGISDWVRSWIFTGFPWLTLGYSQVPYSPLAGFAPITGIYGVSILAALIAGLMAAWTIRASPTYRRNSIVIITLLLGVGGLLSAAEWTSPVGKPLQVALLQGNIAQDVKWSPENAQRTIDTYLQMVKQSRSPFIILPETALPVIASQLDTSVKEALTAHAINNGGDIVVGMVEYDFDSNAYFNSALSFGSAPSQAYRKNHLVPFGEFIPLKQVFGWIYRDWLNMPLSDLSRGGWEQASMQVAGQHVGINICYEDVFGEEIIRQIPEATLLVNISNDAWYGRSIAADQHMQFSQARALETGRMMLRATNTGATAAVDTHGYVLAHAPHDQAVILETQAQGYTGTTPYARWGNWPFILLSFAAMAFVLSRKNK
ncbi:MAG TPA: apolipoprotein N-acyltransferase [Methylophilus sp.]|nr:apolipoprotein N-acyltransferase [Methylophilus sp.]HQQ33265.1 apolipoprotein N-acyltransferase [Methylophilus sp.]